MPSLAVHLVTSPRSDINYPPLFYEPMVEILFYVYVLKHPYPSYIICVRDSVGISSVLINVQKDIWKLKNLDICIYRFFLYP